MRKRQFVIALVALVVAAGLRVATPAAAQLPGPATNTGYAVRSDESNVLYQIALNTGVATPVGDTMVEDLECLAFDPGGALWAISDENNSLYIINQVTGQSFFVVALDRSVDDPGCVFDETGTLWLSSDDDDAGIFRVNISTGATSLVAALGNIELRNLAFRNGKLFGIRNETTLVTVNRTTGALTAVGLIGLDLGDDNGLAFGPTGVLYGLGDSNGRLVTLNTTNGAATQIATTLTGFENLAIWTGGIYADTTAPEFNFEFDPYSRGVTVFGRDEIGGSGLTNHGPVWPTTCAGTPQQQCIYRIADMAGNTTTLTLGITRTTTQTRVRVLRIQYGGQAAMTPLTNEAVYSYVAGSAAIKPLGQQEPPLTIFTQSLNTVDPIPVNGVSQARQWTANWLATAGTTTVQFVKPAAPSQTFTCMVLLRVATSQGGLRPELPGNPCFVHCASTGQAANTPGRTTAC